MIAPRMRISWPAPALWPNRKAHWAQNKTARDAQKREAYFVAHSAGMFRPIHPVHNVHLTLTFCAPSRRRYDLDGALSACKGAIDGLSACLGLDDSLFTYTLLRGEKSAAGGVLIDPEIR